MDEMTEKQEESTRIIEAIGSIHIENSKRDSLFYLKSACPEHWGEIDKYPVDKMLELIDKAIKESYNQALSDISNYRTDLDTFTLRLFKKEIFNLQK